MTTPETLLAGYVLEERIAVGGMAEIFRARRQGPAGFAKRVAIKKVLPDLARDPSFVAMFLDEARLAARLSSANLVQVFDFGEEDGAYFMVMEYVDGVDLAALFSHVGLLSIPAALFVAQELCRGLEHLHAACGDDGRPLHVVHRDVTPANVLLSRTGDVKLGDFGVAKARARTLRTARNAIKGKLAYLSPEQARGEELDARSDLYAIGLVLYEALTGVRVLDAMDEVGLLKLAEKPVWRPPSSLRHDLPGALDAVLARLLAAEPERRIPTARLVAAALSEAVPLVDVGTAREELANLVEPAIVDQSGETSESCAALDAPPSDRASRPPLRQGTEVLAVASSTRPSVKTRRVFGAVGLGLAALFGVLVLWSGPDATEFSPEVVSSNSSGSPKGPEIRADGQAEAPDLEGPARVPPPAKTPPPAKRQPVASVVGSVRPVPSPLAERDPALADTGASGPTPADLDRVHAALAAVDATLSSRHLLAADIPMLNARRVALVAAMDRGETPVADLEKLKADLGRIVIDRAFIDAKLFRLNKAMASRPIDETTKKKLNQHAQAALSSSVQGRYDVANQELNEIAAVLEP